jgi:hypothetical protein
MKSINKEYLSRIMQALRTAYHEKEKSETGDLLRVRVMGHVLSLEPSSPQTAYLELFQQLLWKLTPVTCILVVVLGLVIAKMDFIESYELAKSFINDPADFILLTLYYG